MNTLDLESRLLYRDGLMLVIDKPAGIPVHGGPGGGDNLENHFDALRFGLPRPPALAHRLDRDTSGCLVLGRHPKALRKLHRLFSEGRVEKTYWAVTKGAPEKLSGTVDAPLKKETRGAGWRVVIAGKARSPPIGCWLRKTASLLSRRSRKPAARTRSGFISPPSARRFSAILSMAIFRRRNAPSR